MHEKHHVPHPRPFDPKQISPLHKTSEPEDESLETLKADAIAMTGTIQDKIPPKFETAEATVVASTNQENDAQADREKSMALDASSEFSGQIKKQKETVRHDQIAAAYLKSSSEDVEIPICLSNAQPDQQCLSSEISGLQNLGISSTSSHTYVTNYMAPPVTKETLKELELSTIQNNLTLRIDLVFDQGLYFQPITGSRGQEKQQSAKAYWDSLSLELKTYIHDLRGDCEDCDRIGSLRRRSRPSQLFILFSTLRELLEMLVPETEREDVKTRLDVEWYVRLVRTGQFEAAPFAQWLSKLITMHCAPMRDQMARDMHRKIAEGAELGDMDTLVSGLSLLFNLLEKMKLDVANHQIRTFKCMLITDAVPFLQDCYSKMIASNQFDLSGTKSWFQQALKIHKQKTQDTCDTSGEEYFDIFVQGAVDLLKSSADEPEAIFTYDKERLDALRNDMIDIIQWQICEDTLRQLTQRFSQRQPTTAEIQTCSERVLKLIMPEGGHNEGVDCHLRSVAVEIARTAVGASSKNCVTTPDPCINLDPFNEAYRCLELDLCDRYATAEEQHFQTLSGLAQQYAHRFNEMGTLQLSDAQKAWAEKRSAATSLQAPDLDDIARRIAHIAVLSWQVWADIAFSDSQDSFTTHP